MQNRGGQQFAGVVVWLVGVCLLVLPESVTSRLRSVVWDLALPGEQIMDRALRDLNSLVWPVHSLPGDSATDQKLSELQNRIRELELQNHDLKVQQDLIPPRIRSSVDSMGPLIIPDLVSARVIGKELSRIWNDQPVLNKGGGQGSRVDLLVLEKERLNLDTGRDIGVQPDMPVYAGRMVIGRIARVGGFTSSVRLITDPLYRGEARLFREQSRRGQSEILRPGGRGILTGNGQGGCQMLDVSPSEPVEVGDWVYTSEEDGILPHAMCYGRVTRAELKPGALHWELDVAPACRSLDLREVYLLRTRLSPGRVAPALVNRDASQAANPKFQVQP